MGPARLDGYVNHIYRAAKIRRRQRRGDLDSPARGRRPAPPVCPVGFQHSATGLDLGFYAARLYSSMRPPRTG